MCPLFVDILEGYLKGLFINENKFIWGYYPSGNSLKNIINLNFPYVQIKTFSRSDLSDFYFDYDKPDFQKIHPELENSILVSFSPIWLFADFFEKYIDLFSKNEIKGIIVCSSSSVITKNYAYNKFDKNLVTTLKKAEKR